MSRYHGSSGSWRGNPSHTRSSPFFRRGHHHDEPIEPIEPPKPFGRDVDTIENKTLLIEEDAPSIENADYVASYNWVDGARPVILVPGSPPAWTPPVQETRLKPDSDPVFRDINAARYAAHPLEPALRAILAVEPGFDLQAVDIIGCGSTLGNLLRFASSRPLLAPFRFDVDLVGDTVFFVRRENSPTELIKGLRGYGHTFPERYTTWDADVRQSCSHQRIIQYNFGGLRFLIRSETDAYVRGASKDEPSNAREPDPSISDILSTISMSKSAPESDQKLVLKMQGRKVPQDRIFDIKTRSERNVFDMNDIIPRLWLNQTSKFLLAYHEQGHFKHPSVKDVRQDVLDWEQSNSVLLAKFHALVKRVVDVVRDSVNRQLEVSWDGQGPLRITEQIGEGRRALPVDLHHYWKSD